MTTDKADKKKAYDNAWHKGHRRGYNQAMDEMKKFIQAAKKADVQNGRA
jgi:hypothetical protein